MHRRTPAERSLIAHLGLLALLLLPFASLVLPQWVPLPQSVPAAEAQLAMPTTVTAASIAASVPVEGPSPSRAPVEPLYSLPLWSELVLWFYAIPLGLLMVAMIVAVTRLLSMRRKADVLVDGAWLAALAQAQRRMGFKHGTALLVSDELRSPISWGLLRPTILLNPRAVSAVSDAEAIIAHELAHVAKLDWAKLLIARTACALFWFNPFVWLLARESHQLREEAADDSVLLTDVSGSDYATLLVNAARHDNNGTLIAAHGVAPAKNSLRRRVERVLDSSVRREPVRSRWAAISLVAALGATAPLAAFSMQTPVEAKPARFATTSPAVTQRPAPGGGATATVPTAPAASAQEATDPRASISAEDLVGMRAVGVTPADVAWMRGSLDEADASEIIAAKATGVSPQYIAAMRAALGEVDASELVGAHAVGVDAAYARAMRAVDPRADLDTIIGARAIGVSSAYAKEIRAHFRRVSLDDLVGMRAVGVTGDYIRQLRAAGVEIGSPDDVTGRRALTSRPRPARTVPRPPQAGLPPGASAVAFPGGLVATGRAGDGAHAVILQTPPPGSPPSED
jgi:beta-lactamase regulating signal transducer with metallopeptidase domain